MERPDLDTLACVNAECALHRKTHQGNLGVHKVYGRDAIRSHDCCEFQAVMPSVSMISRSTTLPQEQWNSTSTGPM